LLQKHDVLLSSISEFELYPNVGKVEDATDPRRQGHSCSNLPQALDNAGDAASSAFPEGKKHDNIIL
jgi:hypothetical protein